MADITQQLLRNTHKLIYATTTPYMPARIHNNTIVDDLNHLARQVMRDHENIDVLDLYHVVTKHCGAVYEQCDWCAKRPCSFHYNGAGSAALGEHVAAALKSGLIPE